MFALGLLSWMYSRPTEAHDRLHRARSSPTSRTSREANLTAFRAGFNFGETTEAFAVSYEVKPAATAARHLPQHQRQPGAGLRLGRRRRSVAGCRCSSAPTRSPRRRTSCTSCPSTSASACAPSRRRTRSPASARRSAPRSAARSRVTTTSGPGIALKGEAIGLAVCARAAAGHLRHPARRPVHRPADQDRAVGPAAGHVRAQRRGAGAGRRAAVPRRLLRRRDRGGPHRAHLPHAGLPALRRLPGQRLRAVAGPGGRRPARPDASSSPPSRTARTARSCPTCAIRRRWPARGPCPARPGWSTASAASRRPTGPATSATTRTTTTSWCAPGRRRSTASRDLPPLEVDDPDGDAEVLVLGWGSTYGPIGAAAGGCGRPGESVAQAHLRHLNPFPANLGDVLARYERVVIPEMNLGQLRMLIRARVPGRRDRRQPGARPAVQGRGARRDCCNGVIQT